MPWITAPFFILSSSTKPTGSSDTLGLVSISRTIPSTDPSQRLVLSLRRNTQGFGSGQASLRHPPPSRKDTAPSRYPSGGRCSNQDALALRPVGSARLPIFRGPHASACANADREARPPHEEQGQQTINDRQRARQPCACLRRICRQAGRPPSQLSPCPR